MPLELITVPCLRDNYAFLVHDAASGNTVCVDVPETAPIQAVLANRGWRLTDIWLTHHHDDHIQGVPALVAATGARVWGAEADAHRLPPLDETLHPGDSLPFCGDTVRVFDVSGHTVGHIALYLPGSALCFTGDSLMAMGCGRIFEGTAPQMWASLQRLAALPPATLICSGHEYTAANARFAQTLDPDNPALISRITDITRLRDAGRPTVPSTLADELNSNPFLRAGAPAIKAAVGMPDAPDAAVFAEIRARKDKF